MTRQQTLNELEVLYQQLKDIGTNAVNLREALQRLAFDLDGRDKSDLYSMAKSMQAIYGITDDTQERIRTIVHTQMEVL